MTEEYEKKAVILAHNYQRGEVQDIADFVGDSLGLIHRLKKENPEKKFFTAGPALMCHNMKLTGLENVYLSLKEKRYKIEIEDEVQKKAKKALDRMLKYI